MWFRERWIYYVHVYRITLFLNYLAQIASSLVLLMLGGPLLISSPAGVVDEDPAARCHKVKAVHLRHPRYEAVGILTVLIFVSRYFI